MAKGDRPGLGAASAPAAAPSAAAAAAPAPDAAAPAPDAAAAADGGQQQELRGGGLRELELEELEGGKTSPSGGSGSTASSANSVDMEPAGFGFGRERSVRILRGKGAGDEEEGRGQQPGAGRGGSDSSPEAPSHFAQNQRSIGVGGRKPAMLQDIRTDSECVRWVGCLWDVEAARPGLVHAI